MDLHEHILKRPDTYVGGMSASETTLDYTFAAPGFATEVITLPSAFVSLEFDALYFVTCLQDGVTKTHA